MTLRSPPAEPSSHADAEERGWQHAPQPRRIRSEQLLGVAGQAVILHRGREYRLRKTQNGKLILTA